MIENRHRIENEILLGRQAVRSGEPRNHVLAPDSSQGDLSTGIRLPRISVSPAPMGSDVPLSVDTDAETAYATRAHSSFKRGGSTEMSGVLTPRDTDNNSNRDPLRSPLTRRQWISDLLDTKGSDPEGSENDYHHSGSRVPVPSASASNTNTIPSTSPGGFFTRFRTQSFPALRQNKRPGKESSRNSTISHTWSSDSSSEDLVLDD
jgi:hypothetical protein